MKIIRYKTPNIFQLKEIAISLTFVGGFIDAYTFAQRGGALAAGQTGNIIFLSVDLANHNLPNLMTKLLTILSFIFGVFIVGCLKHRSKRSHYWRLTFLVLEFLVCILVGFLPRSTPDSLVVPLLALVMAMQTTAFSQIEGQAYNNVFSTGNLKKAVNALTDYLFSKDKTTLQTSLIYGQLVLGFASGAVVSALLQPLFGVKTILINSVLLVIIGGYYIYLLHQRALSE